MSLPPPGMGPDLTQDLSQWALDAVWVGLVTAFGGNVADLPDDPSDRLAWLDDFSKRWDVRRGHLERDQTGELPLTPHQVEATVAAADRLGLTTVNPPRFREYDHVLALGGLIRACFIRPAYAARLMREEVVSAPSFIGLGGHRRFSDDERRLADRAGLGQLDSEFGALDAGVRTAFEIQSDPTTRSHTENSVGGSWTVNEYQADDLRVLVAAAPSSEPAERRANTADTYHWLAEELVHLRPGQRLLAVTTPIYVPAQQAAAVRMLSIPYGVTVDTVGTDPAMTPEMWQQDFSPTRYLMEIRAAIRAMESLAETGSAG